MTGSTRLAIYAIVWLLPVLEEIRLFWKLKSRIDSPMVTRWRKWAKMLRRSSLIILPMASVAERIATQTPRWQIGPDLAMVLILLETFAILACAYTLLCLKDILDHLSALLVWFSKPLGALRLRFYAKSSSHTAMQLRSHVSDTTVDTCQDYRTIEEHREPLPVYLKPQLSFLEE